MTTDRNESDQLHLDLSSLASSLRPPNARFIIPGWSPAGLKILDSNPQTSPEDAESLGASARDISSKLEPGEILSPNASPTAKELQNPFLTNDLFHTSMSSASIIPATDNPNLPAEQSQKLSQRRSLEELKKAAKQSIKARQATSTSQTPQAEAPKVGLLAANDSLIKSGNQTGEMYQIF